MVFSISSFAYTSSDFPSGVFNDVDQVSVSIDTTEISNYLSSSQIENLRSDYGDVYLFILVVCMLFILLYVFFLSVYLNVY